jgi:hypothetical protein
MVEKSQTSRYGLCLHLYHKVFVASMTVQMALTAPKREMALIDDCSEDVIMRETA